MLARDSIKKILLVELLGLGDNIHSLPLLWRLRQDYPDAELHVMVRKGNAGLFQLTPWIQRVWPYQTQRKAPDAVGMRALIRQLRAEKFDLVVNPSGNDRSTWLTAFGGGRTRVGRLQEKNNRWLWRRLHDQVLDYPHGIEPKYMQKLRAWTQFAGGPAVAQFQLTVPEAAEQSLALPPGSAGRWLHVSPFASEDRRCLPLYQMVELLEGLRARFPAHPLVLSCAPSPRELTRLDTLIQHLSFSPARVFNGNLDTAQLAALLHGCALHLGPDSGAVHLAWALGRPTVGWFRLHGGTGEWAPLGRRSRVVGTPLNDDNALLGIRTADLLEAAAQVLEA